jgi:hypothetical protein
MKVKVMKVKARFTAGGIQFDHFDWKKDSKTETRKSAEEGASSYEWWLLLEQRLDKYNFEKGLSSEELSE